MTTILHAIGGAILLTMAAIALAALMDSFKQVINENRKPKN